MPQTRSEWLCDTSELNRIIDALSRVTGATQMEVLEQEVSAILQSAVRRTKAAKVSAIRAAFAKKTWVKLRGKRYYLQNLFPDALWADIQDMRKETLRRRLQRRGLAKQSWDLLARALGMTIETPAYAQNANVAGRTFPENVRSKKGKQADKAYIEGTNAAPGVDTPGADGRRALAQSVSGRSKFFERNLASGVFTKVADIARAYPGLKLGPLA